MYFDSSNQAQSRLMPATQCRLQDMAHLIKRNSEQPAHTYIHFAHGLYLMHLCLLVYVGSQDMAHLIKRLRLLLGDLTFLEAYERTGERISN